MQKKCNWGILGLGRIAHKFAHDLLLAENANLYAVASRSLDKAQSFSKQYQANTYYDSYEALANDENIDVIYIATPHVFHCENTLMCLKKGKAVLCEKAFGINQKEVESMINMARQKNVFLMEALWTRFIPATVKILELIENQTLGALKMVQADFGFLGDTDPEKRLFNKNLGGGALLDIGIYPIYLSLLTLGVPDQIKTIANFSKTNVDTSVGMLFGYESGKMAVLNATLETNTQVEGWIHGEKGSIKLPRRFHHAKEVHLFQNGEKTDSYFTDYVGFGYYHEIIEVMECLSQGQLESEKMSHQDSLNLIKTMDKIRAEIGLEY